MPKPEGLLCSKIISEATTNIVYASTFVRIKSAVPNIKKGFARLDCKTYSTADAQGNAKKGTPEVYKTTVYAMEPDKRLHLSRVKVSCSCPAHVFQGGEYALWTRGAADIIYGNGDPPLVNNPRLKNYPCKHLYALLKKIVAKRV